MDRCIELLNKLKIDKKTPLIVGCSTGGDSMCLMDVLYSNGYSIICAHVNHNIRKESDKEYDFLEKYCNEKNIIFEGFIIEKNPKFNESTFRTKRYNFYKNLADKYKTPYILTAHHGDDLIETVLMRISRGSTLKGYQGFKKYYKEEKYIFIKPLIYYTKNDLLEYNKNHEIPYFNDITNDDDKYTRNRYRHYILPFLKNENKNVHLKYLKFSEDIREINEFLDKQTKIELKENYKNKILDLRKFNILDICIKKRELEIILSSLYKNDIDKINKDHIARIISLSNDTQNKKIINLPNNFKVIKNYEQLEFKKTELKNQCKFLFEFKGYCVYDNWEIITIFENDKNKSNNIIKLNSKEIALPLYIRTKKMGDKIELKNAKGHKNLKKLFIDKKVPVTMRNIWPILVDSNDNILWVPGLYKSKFDNENPENCDIILKYIRKEEINE